MSENKKYSLLYIGRDNNFIQFLNENSDKFTFYLKENPLFANEFLNNNKDIAIDVIICETNLPGNNGIEVYKMLSKKLFYKNTPFILVNDKEFTPDTIKYALENGISDYFVKPINANDFLIRIEYLILFKKTHHIKKQSKKIKYKKTKYKIPTTKRIFDIVFSGLALLILSPILLLTALIIWIDSGFKGNVFYKSKRVGTGYKIFNFYKFRSMKIGADKELKDLKTLNQYQETEPFEIDFDKECPRCKKLGHPCSTILIIGDKKICENFYLAQKKQNANSTFIKIMNDPRITRFGKFIRKTSIDELPQLINVLKGDMSIVGNRPLPLYEAELLTSDNWTERFLAPAGITGLWQISKRGKADMSEEERKKLDNEYAKKNSFWFDIKIILKTIPALFQKENV